MARVAYLPALLGFVSLAAPAATGTETLVTTTPLDSLAQCLRDRLSPVGRVTAINTAAGTMLDFAFDTVGTTGRIVASRLSFSIEDRGTDRTVSAGAADPADAPLAARYLRQAGGRCIAEGEARPADHGAP